MKKIGKIIFNIILGLAAALGLLFIITSFPIKGNIQAKVVLSGSMEPKIHTGSVVFIKPTKEYKINDIITFNEAEKKTPITHRIVEMRSLEGNIFYKTKGDANNAPDNKEIGKDQVVGKVLFTLPYLGYAVDVIRKPIGFMAMIVIMAIFVYEAIKNLYREVGEQIKKIGNKPPVI